MTTAYLASPIDLHSMPDMVERRAEIRDLAFEMGFSAVFDPSSAWTLHTNSKPNPGLQEVNIAALRAATALVAWIPPGVPTLGVPLEIQVATEMGKPTLVMGPDRASWTLAYLARSGTLFYENDLEGFVAMVAGRTRRGDAISDEQKRARALDRELTRREMMDR